jgi:hypothetical protein
MIKGYRLIGAIGVAVGALGLFAAFGGAAGATTTSNNVSAQTNGKGQTSVSVAVAVNGQIGGNFVIPSVQGPVLNDPSSAVASSIKCSICMTNAIAINVNVVSGPLTDVYVPTFASALNADCLACNTLAADYTFVVSPGTQSGLSQTGLDELTYIASQVTLDANTPQSSADLANEVSYWLGEIAYVLQTQIQPPLALSSLAQTSTPAVSTAPPIQVQQYGSTQFSNAVNG